MKPKPFDGPRRKIKWANREIKKLETAIKKRFDPASCTTRSRVSTDGTEETYEFRPRNVPANMSIQAKNILQNLRESLDNTLAEVSMQHRGKDNGVSFPFADTAEKYEAELDKLTKLLPAKAIDLIRKASTQPGGSEHLRALHYLNRDQKHRVAISPINVGSSFTMESLVIDRGQLVRLGYKHGSHMVYDASQNLVAGPGPAPMLDLDGHGSNKPAMVFKPDIAAGDNDREFITVKKGAKFNTDIRPSFDVALTQVTSLKRQPIVTTLREMSKLVEEIVASFEGAFPS
jgi:hypothetical protein